VPEITLGVYPPVAVALLAQVTGYHYAAEMILTGHVIDAETASETGLVNHVYPAGIFRDQVSDYMEKFTRLSAFSLGQTRRALRNASWNSFEEALTASEASYLEELMRGSDPAEGLAAFMRKRPPQWLDR
jgi:enoyl-CoA hydratase/carnithine racemase